MDLGNMTPLSIIADPEESKASVGTLDGDGRIVLIGGLPRGTARGKATIGMVVVDNQSGRRIYCETTLRLFIAAADVLRIRYADELADPNP